MPHLGGLRRSSVPICATPGAMSIPGRSRCGTADQRGRVFTPTQFREPERGGAAIGRYQTMRRLSRLGAAGYPVVILSRHACRESRLVE